MTTPRKEIKREARREQKAEKAALLDKVVLSRFLLNFGIFLILKPMKFILFLQERFFLY